MGSVPESNQNQTSVYFIVRLDLFIQLKSNGIKTTFSIYPQLIHIYSQRLRNQVAICSVYLSEAKNWIRRMSANVSSDELNVWIPIMESNYLL